MNGDMSTILRQLIAQKDLTEDVLIDAVQAALQAAAKKRYGAVHDVQVDFDAAAGEVRVFVTKQVVDIMRSYATEIPIEEAQKLDPTVQVGDLIQVQADTRDFGRIEAQTARQILVQKLKEAEREMIYEEYKDREGEIVIGVVQRIERGDVFFELERTEGILPYSEQVRRETYHRGDQMRCLIIEVPSNPKGAPILLSRADPGLIARLFELEVPEIYDGLVRIMAIARDPGDRAKVAVAATDENIDAVGTCVGMRGSRVQMVVRELRGEKIDILEWSPDPEVFIANALSTPAKITRVIVDEESETAEVIVPEDQLSLAIGRRGQNARLAARLTGWKIDIVSGSETQTSVRDRMLDDVFKSEEELTQEPSSEESTEETAADLTRIPGIGEKTAAILQEHGYAEVETIANTSTEKLSMVPGVGVKTAERIIQAAKQLIEGAG